ncbi:HBR543Wp [Eremothecium sinecaudum]|uniref:HBR543Wp n=1 Tax=Eremothecium sinecaudum TaxID=45286 RepID=A0A120K1J0_9SACH|nr:HBR543Wp [Eremothecium sinecaudum]AMD19444.1 HBR543Wp [Eremothecium sinecaudum]
MFGIGNGLNDMDGAGSIKLNMSEEKFDYTESEFDENDDSTVSEGKIKLDRSFNFRGFMNRLNGKHKALELAGQLDSKRGVSEGIEVSASTDGPKEYSENEEKALQLPMWNGQAGIRQGQHGHKANMETSTPMKQSTKGDLVVQSTPLAKPGALNRTQPKDILREKLIENHNRKVSVNSVNSGHTQRDIMQETRDLREEMSKLQEELAASENHQLEKDGEISQLNRKLNDKESQILELKKQLESKNSELMTFEQKSATAAESIVALTERNKQKDAKIKSLEQSLENSVVDTEAEVTNLNKVLEQVTLEYKKYKIETKLRLDESESTLRKAEERSKELQEKLESKSLELSEMNSKLSEMNTKLSEMNNRLSEMTNKLTSRETEISNLQAFLNESNTRSNTLQSDKEALTTEVQNQKEKLTSTIAEMQSLKDTLEKLNDEKNTDITTIKDELEQNWKQKADMLKESEKECRELKSTLADKTKELSSATSQLKKITSERDSVKKFIEQLKCFDIPIGSLAMEQYKKSPKHPSINLLLKEKQDILRFYLKSDEEAINKLNSEIDALKTSNDDLRAELELKLKSTAEKYGSTEASMKREILSLQSDLKERTGVIDKLQSTVDMLQKDAAALIREKEESVNRNAELAQQISKLQESQLQEDHEKFVELCDKNQELIQKCSDLTEKIHEVEVKLHTAESKAESLQNELNSKESIITEKQQLITELQLTQTQIQKSLEKLKGNPADMISFDSAQKTYHNLDRKTYNHLMVDQVNHLDLVQLQNIVKNIILLLETPFSKLSKKMPLVSIYLRYEKSLCFHFANMLHYHVYHEPIDIKKFTNDAYSQYLERHDFSKIRHPLELCLEKLYEEVRSRLKY